MIVIVAGRVSATEVTQAILLLAYLASAEGPEGPEEPCVPHTTRAVFTESAACAICLEPLAAGAAVRPAPQCAHALHLGEADVTVRTARQEQGLRPWVVTPQPRATAFTARSPQDDRPLD